MYYPVSCFDEVISTFWNPLDVYGCTLSNRNYTVLVDDHGSADNTRPHAGWDNLESTTEKQYWEVQVEICESSGISPQLSFGLRSAWDGMAIHRANNVLSGSYEERELRFNSDSGMVVAPSTIPDIAVWHSNPGTAPSPVHDFIEIQGNFFGVDITGVSGFEGGDVLMFALDRTAGNFWIGKNGTWFNSGNPATSTNPQVTNMDCSEAQYGGMNQRWRFFFATTGINYGASPVKFHLATGSNIIPQQYSPPSGFTGFIAPSSITSIPAPNWNFRDSGQDWMGASSTFNFVWMVGNTIALNAVDQFAPSACQMHVGGKYYFEATNGVAEAQVYVGIALLLSGDQTQEDTGIQCLWRQTGALSDGSGSITIDSTGVSGWTTHERLMFAVDLVAGKMWIGKVGTWFNSGDPAAGTNPQFSGLPLTNNWVVKTVVTNGARDMQFPGTVTVPDFDYTTPTGFTTGIPLVVPYAP